MFYVSRLINSEHTYSLQKFNMLVSLLSSITKLLEKQFCPGCGNATLFKVAVSIDNKGVTHYITRASSKVNLRGTKVGVFFFIFLYQFSLLSHYESFSFLV